RWLAECLDALATQTRPPDRLVVVDVASTDSSAAIATAHQAVRRAVPDVSVASLDEVAPTAVAIDQGICRLGSAAPGEWVWVLHDDSAAEPTALARLIEAVRRSPSVGVAGPKIVSWEDPHLLVELGVQITRTGRQIASPLRGEPDQGQHDGRTDVLAVTTNGMLVRRGVYAELGGFDPSFVHYGADLDFGWRAQLAGHRVIVVPGAVVRDASARLDGERPGGPRPAEIERRTRLGARQVALARCSPLAAPFLAIWMALSALVSSATLLLAKRPRQAWRELADIAVLIHPVAIQRARWRARRIKRLRRSDLATLFVTPGAAARTTIDHIQDAITPERTRPQRAANALSESGPLAEESESLHVLPASLPHRIITHPGFLAVVATLAATLAAWRVAIRAGALSVSHTGVAGGQLRAVSTGSDGLWHAFRDAWHGSGLGTGADSGPYLAVLSGVTWLAERLPGVAESRSPAGVTIAWLLFLAPVLSAWFAYLAGRVATSSRVARAIAALGWGVGAVVTVGVSHGRVTAVVAHVLLPLVLAGFVLAARRDGTYTGAFATALAAAVLGSVAPPLLALTAIAALVMIVIGPGTRRLRGLVLLVVPAALLGPWLLRFVEDWRLLLSGPGLVSTSPAPPPWQPLLGIPEAGMGAWAWALAPVVVLGLAGYMVRATSRAESVGLAAGALLAITGLAIALTSSRVVLGSAETAVGVSAPAHLWVGLGTDVWFAGILIGLLVGSRAVLRLIHRPYRRWSFVGAITVVVLAVLPVLAITVRWGWTGIGTSLTVGKAMLPAVAVEQATGPLSNRMLLLNPSDTVVDFQLVGEEPGELLRDLDRHTTIDDTTIDDAALVQAVASLVGGRGSTAPGATAVARFAVAFVQVKATADSPLARRLDASDGLSRLGTSAHGILWKVQPIPSAPGAAGDASPPSRVRLVDAKGRWIAAVPTVGPHAAVDSRIPKAKEPRMVVFAESPQWSGDASVTLDGRVLEPESGQEQPSYVIPNKGGHLKVDLAAAQPWWRIGQAALLAFVVFMAVPFGNRRSRRRT
ncbi:MAG: glycosyltransferase family 2 protein, partial [Micrococcales bacterium]|nr:glycosyltransferase family 2 protein [Micrococcales bacterium]